MDPKPSQPKPFIIPIFLPHSGCPHRCVFCDQSTITGQKTALPGPEQIRREIRTFLSYKKGARAPVQISFYGGNFLGQPEKSVRRQLDIASEFIASTDVDTIRFSTRPDTIDPGRLEWLSGYRVATVEIGAQSMDDTVLKKSRRGHTARDTENAMALLKAGGYETGLQILPGLPGDTVAGTLETGRRVLALAPDIVRIYPAVVLAGSPLATWFETGRYTPPPIDAAVELTARLYRLFENGGVRVIRMGLQAAATLSPGTSVLAGPYHPAFGQLVMAKLFFDSICRVLERASECADTISIAVNPRSVSNLKGQKNRNLDLLKHRFSIREISVLTEFALAETVVVVNAGDPVSILNGA